MNDHYFEAHGKVIQARGNANFLVRTDEGNNVSCTLASNIKNNNIRILEGDDVKILVSAHDTSRGRITFRKK